MIMKLFEPVRLEWWDEVLWSSDFPANFDDSFLKASADH